MKLWKRWTAAVLAAAMALLLLAACGPSGPSAPDTPDTPGSSETGKDPAEMTETQKVAAVVEALNTVREKNGLTRLELNADACAMAEKMAKLQLDGKIGKYGTDPMKSEQYAEDWNAISKLTIKDKKLVGVGGYVGYPTKRVISGWTKDPGKWKPALVTSAEATLVGVGVVQNTDDKTKDKYPIMVVVMTY